LVKQPRRDVDVRITMRLSGEEAREEVVKIRVAATDVPPEVAIAHVIQLLARLGRSAPPPERS
jgi:hypothetical protein